MVNTVASLLVLINTQGLASWTGLPGLTMRGIFSAALMEVIVQGATGKLSWVASYASQDGYC